MVRGSVARVVPFAQLQVNNKEGAALSSNASKKVEQVQLFGCADESVAHCKMSCIMNTERKVAVVTGASRGLGEGIANAFRHQGYRVVGTSRSIEPSDDPDYLTVAGDIGDPATGKMVIEKALPRFGRVDTLINNAGIFIPNAFTKYTDQQYRDLLSTNLNGFSISRSKLSARWFSGVRAMWYRPRPHSSSMPIRQCHRSLPP
jgi:hypothetical protein